MKKKSGLRMDNNIPSRRVRDAQIDHLAVNHEIIERMHQLLDRRRKIPPMQPQQINILGAQLPQTRLHRMPDPFTVIPAKIALYDPVVPLVGLIGGGEFGGNDHLVAVGPLAHPVPDPGLGLLGLVVGGGVDEVAALGFEKVEDLKGGRLVAGAEEGGPRGAKGHAAQAEGGDAHGGAGGELAVVSEEGFGGAGDGEGHG